jgi:hypothetical protein
MRTILTTCASFKRSILVACGPSASGYNNINNNDNNIGKNGERGNVPVFTRNDSVYNLLDLP